MRSKPNGSKITEIEELNGVTYRWDHADLKIIRWLMMVVGFVQLGVMFGVMIPQMIQQQGQIGMALPFDAIVVGVFALPFMGMFYLFLRKGLPESVTLGDDFFRYDPGRQSVLSVWFNPWFMMKYPDPTQFFTRFFWRRKPIELSRSELGRIILDRAGERQRLCFDVGADRIEIGESLREPEREWLASVIQDWQCEER